MDKVFESWLERQCIEAMALSAQSDVLEIAFDGQARPPRRYIARLRCPTLVMTDAGVSRTVEGCTVLIQFPEDYLRTVTDPTRIVGLLSPLRTFHPNVAPPFVCVGHVAPGTGLCELLYQVYEILTFARLTPREDNALNRLACAWARRNLHLFPLSRAPLRRRSVEFSIAELPQQPESSHHARR